MVVMHTGASYYCAGGMDKIIGILIGFKENEKAMVNVNFAECILLGSFVQLCSGCGCGGVTGRSPTPTPHSRMI